MFFIPSHGVQAGACGEVSINIGIIPQQLVCNASGYDFGPWVHDFLGVAEIDVAPPGLGMPDEVHFREFF